MVSVTPSQAATFTLDSSPQIAPSFQVNAEQLCDVAQNTTQYLTHHKDDKKAVHAGTEFPSVITLERVTKTLAFICNTNKEDTKKLQTSRLTDAKFLKKHFDFYHWRPDKKTASTLADKSNNAVKSRLLRNIPADQILLTKYYTKLLTGSETRTTNFSQALYALPDDEAGLTREQVLAKAHKLTRFKYTRQDIINGALLEKSKAKPLIWLTEEALHDVLLQGTGVLEVNGKIRYFNVHRNNGISYDYAIGKREQARYWYFAEVPSIMGYGQDIDTKIAIKPHVSFAGNVKELGLGKLIMVSYSQQLNGVKKQLNSLGVLADEGGAFDNNLFQLDFLVGSYKGWADYYQHNKHLPDYAKAWVLLIKE